MTVEEGYNFFIKIPIIRQKLQTLMDVGFALYKNRTICDNTIWR